MEVSSRLKGDGRHSFSMFRLSILALITAGVLLSSGCGLVQRYPEGPVSKNFENTSCVDTIKIETGVSCAEATRNIFGEFLVCREERQLITGGAIATLAAAASGVAAAGVSWVAAASLGATSGAGLGLEVALYNKPKTKAYADASVQLQCVVDDTVPMQGKLDEL